MYKYVCIYSHKYTYTQVGMGWGPKSNRASSWLTLSFHRGMYQKHLKKSAKQTHTPTKKRYTFKSVPYSNSHSIAVYTNEPQISTKGPYVSIKEPQKSAKETYTPTKSAIHLKSVRDSNPYLITVYTNEPQISTKEPYVSVKALYILSQFVTPTLIRLRSIQTSPWTKELYYVFYGAGSRCT